MSPFLAGALVSVLGTGLIQAGLHRGRVAREDHQRLIARISAFTAALDALTMEVRSLPDFPSPRVRWLSRLIERRLRSLDFVLGRIARLLFGRQVGRSIERLQVAICDLAPIAPPLLADLLSEIFGHLSAFGPAQAGDPESAFPTKDQWLAQMQTLRGEFGEVTRELARHGSSKSLESGPRFGLRSRFREKLERR